MKRSSLPITEKRLSKMIDCPAILLANAAVKRFSDWQRRQDFARRWCQVYQLIYRCTGSPLVYLRKDWQQYVLEPVNCFSYRSILIRGKRVKVEDRTPPVNVYPVHRRITSEEQTDHER